MFTGGLSIWHVLIVVVVFVVLFGAKRLPDAARSLGRSARIFKAETQGLLGDDDKQQAAPTQTAEAQRLQDQAAQLRAQAAQLEQAAKTTEDGAVQGTPVAKPDRNA
jgi:sec-independent protein translocase protein TatA